MATLWTMEYDAEEKSLVDWGIEGLFFTFTNQGADAARFKVTGQTAFDAAPTFDYDEVVKFYAREGAVGVGGTKWFEGRVRKTPRDCRATDEFQGYQIAGPWQDLEEIVFRQNWAFDAGGQPTSFVWLNSGRTMGQQIGDVLTWATAAPPTGCQQANLQAGTITPSGFLPVHNDRDRMCAEVIRNQLHIRPDAVVYFDYSTSPPTMHVKVRSELASVSKALPGAFEEGNIVERSDLQLPCVVLNFVRVDTDDGEAKYVHSQQKYPDGASGLERGAMVNTFDLQGAQVTRVKCSIETVVIDANHGNTATDADRVAWWKLKHPEFAQKIGDTATDRYTEIEITYVKFQDKDGVTISDIATTPNEVVNGQFSPWLTTAYGYTVRQVKVSALISFQVRNDDGTTIQRTCTEQISCDIIATDAATGDYSAVSQVVPGEAAPAGLAQYIYEGFATLQYEGHITFTDQDCDGTIRPGKVLNLTSASNRFAAMNAVIQTVEEDIDRGRTTVAFGPPRQLGPSEILEYLRALRWLKVWVNPAVQDSGLVEGQDVEMGGYAGRANSSSKLTGIQSMFIKSASGGIELKDDGTIVITNATGSLTLSGSRIQLVTSGKSVDINLADLASGKTLTVREQEVCDANLAKHIHHIGTAPY